MPQDMSRTLEANLVDFHVHLSDAPAHDAAHAAKISVRNLDFWYGDKHALKDVSLDIFEREVVAFIGPSGCGKSTLLRCLNRSNDIVAEARMTGRVLMDGADIYAPDLDPPLVRRRFGWVAQKPNPFPRSIYENVAYGPRLHGLVSGRRQTDALVRDTLERVGLWGEVKDRLRSPGTDLSGGQQQRLCIARAIAIQPEVVLMDEPCSALDPNATMRIEALIAELRRDYAIVIITHNMQQAARVSQRVAVLHLGRLVEEGDAERVFSRPEHDITRSYLAGRFG